MGYIYKITNDINNKLYVGQTRNSLFARFSSHKKDAKRGDKTKFYNAIRKYGVEHFVISVIEECNNSLLNEREAYWIKKLNTARQGYNTQLGGGSSSIYTDEEKELWWEEFKDGLTLLEIAKKHKVSIDTISSFIHTKPDYRKFVGIHYGNLNRRVSRSQPKKKIMQFDLNGNYIKTWCSANEIRKNGNYGDVKGTCQYRHKQSGGFQWLYEDEYNKGVRVEKLKDKTIYQFTKDMKFVGKYKTQLEAQRKTKTQQTGISLCLLGKAKTANNYVWKYGEDLC